MIYEPAGSRIAVTGTQAETLMKRATYASLAVAILLISVQLAAWILTDSVSLLSSVLDSVLDGMASALNLLAIRHAVMPADREHRFGHGKAEPLAGLAQSAFIAGSAVFLLVEGAHRLAQPAQVSHSAIGIAAMVFAIIASFCLIRYERYVVQRTGSLAIGADELHYRSHLFLILGVILSLVATNLTGITYIDPICGMGIGLWIIYGARQVTKLALLQLMDHELPDSERQRVRDIALAHREVIGIHDLRTRASGSRAFIQIHLEMDGSITLAEAHRISDEVEAALVAAFPHAEILTHEDPAGLAEPRQHLAGESAAD